MSSLTHSSRVSSGRLAVTAACWLVSAISYGAGVPGAHAELAAVGSNYDSQLGFSEIVRVTPAPAMMGNVIAMAGNNGGLSSDATQGTTLVVKADGTVWGWGGNSSGLLGAGQPSTCVSPVKIAGLSGVRSVAVGVYCALALRTDGTVWGWGYNYNGLLGDWNTSGHDAPRPIPGLSSITAISFVGGHALALKSDGTVWAWGYDNKGQLGDNSWFPRCSPVQVLSDATAIAASGASFSMALKSDGTVWVWGNGNYWVPKQYNNPRLINIRSIAAGSAHCLAVTATGIVYGWGENLVAVPVPTSSVDFPSETFFPIVTVSNLTGVAKVAACNDYSLALKSDGTVWAWGANHEGQMADTNSSYHWTPVQIPNLTSIDALAAGYVHCMALRPDGTLWTWGLNKAGQLGRGDRTTTYTGGLPRAPSQVPNSTGYTSVSAGHSHNLAIRSDGSVYAWGSGVLGDGTASKISSTPVQVAGLSNVTAVSAGYGHSLALKSDGTVAAWGSYESDYGPSEVLSPRTVNDVNNAVAVAASKYSTYSCYYFSLALRSDGTVYAWGYYNDWPSAVYGLSGVSTIAAGADFALALKTDGTVIDLIGCPPDSPTQVLSGAVAVAAGAKRLALKADGTVWTWDSARTPTQVPGLTDITAISSGYSFSLALRSDGTVWAWGSNQYGQLGDLTNTSRTTPVQVQGIASVTKVEAGAYHALFFGSLQSALPFVWPPDASCERGIRQLLVRFNQPVSNVSVDDLLLSGGTVTGVTGDAEGPYVFSVADVPDGPISATLGGDISVTGGTALAPQTWSFTSGGPNVTQEPATQVGCAGQTFQFAVTATGVSTYQWQKDGVALSDDGHYSGTVTPILTVQAATASDLGNYFCVLNGDCTVVAGPAALIFSALVPTPPVTWPLCLGSSASFPVTITGEASYQWQKDGVNLTDNQHFYGTNNSCLSVYNVTNADAGAYSCTVTTSCGTSVLNAGSILSQPFAIVSQPQPQTACYSAPVTFTVGVTGDGTLTYQWQKNGVSIGDGGGIVSGSRTASLTLWPNSSSYAAKYRCVVTGPCGTITSSEAQLTLIWPTITLQPTAQSACPGETATFTVETPCDCSVWWQKNYTTLSDDGRYSGTRTKTLRVLVIDPSTIGNYRCVLAANVISNQVPLTYRSPAPAITQQPQPQSACPGSSAQFTVAASGSNLTYLWYKNAVELQDGGHYSGVTTPILTISDVDSGTFGNYGCMVTGNECALGVASNAPALSLCTRSVQQWSSVHSHAGTDRGIGVDAAMAGTTPIIENRQGGIQKLQVRFDGPVILADPAAITVLAGQTAFTPQVQISPTAADTLELNFTPALPDGACYTVTIGPGAIAGQLTGNASCQVRAMLGDSTGNGAVNLGDVLYIQSRIGQSVDSYSWLDMDLSGAIDMADVFALKALVTGTAAPITCP